MYSMACVECPAACKTKELFFKVKTTDCAYSHTLILARLFRSEISANWCATKKPTHLPYLWWLMGGDVVALWRRYGGSLMEMQGWLIG